MKCRSAELSGLKFLDENFSQATLAEIGITKAQIHEARQVRDAELHEPGMIRKLLDAKLEAGEEPTRAAVKRAIKQNGHIDRDAIDIGKGGGGDRQSQSLPNDCETTIGDADVCDEIAPPEVIAEHILYTIARVNENARVFNKLLKVSVLDREATAGINAAIDGMIKKWRSIQSTVEPKRKPDAASARADKQTITALKAKLVEANRKQKLSTEINQQLTKEMGVMRIERDWLLKNDEARRADPIKAFNELWAAASEDARVQIRDIVMEAKPPVQMTTTTH